MARTYSPGDKKAYERGWRYSSSGADPSLDHLDAKGASEAEYDGYMDAATGREKWHILRCAESWCIDQHGGEPAQAAAADAGVIVFEAFSVETGEPALTNEWKPAEKKQLMAYVMRWRRGGTKWVRLTYPDSTVKEYGRPS